MIYLDYAATTPISEAALTAFTESSRSLFANASSLHDSGTRAEHALQLCRREFAKMINGAEQGIFFTSGGTEANILAIHSIINAHKNKGNHIITSEIEHASLANLFKQLATEGFDITYLPVDNNGLVSVDSLENAITDQTILASIHHGQSEIGTIQNIEKIGTILHEHNIIFHADCVQTFTEIPIDVQKLKLDSLSISSHKIYGPKGTGLCYISPSVSWSPIYKNTTHENGFRPGTVDVPSIISFTTAAQLAIASREERMAKFSQLRKQLIDGLHARKINVTIEGDKVNQLPQIIGLSFANIQGQYIMLECNRYDLHISTGSACQVGMQEPSRTMLALGKTADEALQFTRLSLGNLTTEAEITETIDIIDKIITASKSSSS